MIARSLLSSYTLTNSLRHVRPMIALLNEKIVIVVDKKGILVQYFDHLTPCVVIVQQSAILVQQSACRRKCRRNPQ